MSEIVKFANLQKQMKHDDKEMVPKFLVQGMFGLMLAVLFVVAYGQVNDMPKAGVLVEAPVVQSLEIVMTGDRSGVYTVHDSDGRLLATSSDEMAGFIGVIGRVFDRDRQVAGVVDNPSLLVVRRENGNVAIIDRSIDLSVELIGYGTDNVAAFAKLLD
jgi:putative photosynthetic complex assembly protein